jgi:hypothetical protein
MHCTDDRGTRVKLIPQHQLGIMPGIPSPIPMEVRTRMFGEAQSMQLSREFVVPMFLGLLGIILWGGLWMFISPLIVPSLMVSPMVKGFIVAIVPFLGLPVFMWFIVQRGRHRIARIVASHGYCATCGYALSDIPAASDGCTICPECGSAWRVGESVQRQSEHTSPIQPR